MRVLPIILLVAAAAFLAGGISLIAVGGSWFYALAGAALVASAILLWRGSRWGIWVYGGLLLATVAWALWEAGLDAWALLPRIWFIAALGAWLLLPRSRRALTSGPTLPPMIGQHVGRGAFGALVTIAVGGTALLSHYPGAAQSNPSPAAAVALTGASGDWTTTGGTPGGARFSALRDITPGNVGQLQVAWTYKVGERDPHGLEVTPLKVADSIYLCTGGNVVVSLDAATGAERWRFDAKPKFVGPCRGVSYYRVPDAAGPCAQRIYSNVFDGRLIALDALTGRLCAGFGLAGEVSLTDGMRPVGPAQYLISSSPVIARGRIIEGGTAVAVKGFDEPSGAIRAYDAVTGKLSWAYDAGRPDRVGAPAPGDSFTVGMPKAWAEIAHDDALGLVYVPTATGGASYFGGKRRPVDDQISTAIMALDAETGRRRWIYQFVHHDLWDYDIASQPILVDFRHGGRLVKALVQPTKMGETFVLDRTTGMPIDPVVERRVSQSGAVADERLSPTQPFPAQMPSLSGGLLTEQQMWGLSPFDQMWCRIQFRRARYDGWMTPPGLSPAIVYPGWLGGMDWGGASIAPDGVMLAVTSYMADMVTMTRIDPRRATGHAAKLDRNDLAAYALQADVPYANSTLPFLSPIGVPCQQPPWSRLTALDLVHHRILWSRPLGTGKDNGPFGIASGLPLPMGVPALGGTLMTATGLSFVGASTDRTFRAFDMATGKVLWQAPLPASGIGSPITYRSADGRQIVLTPAGGHKILGGPRGDSLVAFALPRGAS